MRKTVTPADAGAVATTTTTTISLLRGIDLFDGVAPPALDDLARRFVQGDARPGEALEVQERPVRRWHLIVSGHAVVLRDGTPLGLLGHGESWSEHSLLNDQRSPITVVAFSPLRFLSISARHFFDLSLSHPVVSSRIMARSATSVDRLALPVYRALFHMEAADRRRLTWSGGLS
jgi:CRP/FNR family cyclic AMP-dependent transcriptional regulator